MSEPEKLEDEKLIELCRRGDSAAEEELISRYTKHVRSLARPYFLAGGDSEDLIQEGMIGLVKAVSCFNPERDASFRTFAFTCIRNKLYSAIKNASAGKHGPLNNYISFETSFSDADYEAYCINKLSLNQSDDPVEQIIGREAFSELLQTLEGLLSKFELMVLRFYLQGMSYAEISERTEKPVKSIDNAVQRIRRKFEGHFFN